MIGPILFTIGFVSSLCVPALMQTWWSEPEPRYIIQVLKIGVEEVWIFQPVVGDIPENISNVYSSISFPSWKPIEGTVTPVKIDRLYGPAVSVDPTTQVRGGHKVRNTDWFFRSAVVCTSNLLGDCVVMNEDGTSQSAVASCVFLPKKPIDSVDPRLIDTKKTPSLCAKRCGVDLEHYFVSVPGHIKYSTQETIFMTTMTPRILNTNNPFMNYHICAVKCLYKYSNKFPQNREFLTGEEIE